MPGAEQGVGGGELFRRRRRAMPRAPPASSAGGRRRAALPSTLRISPLGADLFHHLAGRCTDRACRPCSRDSRPGTSGGCEESAMYRPSTSQERPRESTTSRRASPPSAHPPMGWPLVIWMRCWLTRSRVSAVSISSGLLRISGRWLLKKTRRPPAANMMRAPVRSESSQPAWSFLGQRVLEPVGRDAPDRPIAEHHRQRHGLVEALHERLVALGRLVRHELGVGQRVVQHALPARSAPGPGRDPPPPDRRRRTSSRSSPSAAWRRMERWPRRSRRRT